MSATAPPAPVQPAVENIIRRFEYAGESANERLMKKHLPAWVISGALNLGLVTAALIIDRMTVKTVVPTSDAVIETSLEDKADDTKLNDLTNPDVGFDSEIPLVTASELNAKVTVEAPDVVNEPVGTPAAKDTPPMDYTMPPGIGPADLTNLGHIGDAGKLMQGAGGLQGNVINAGMLGRSGATKDKLLREGGGNAESERAVALGLAWLAKQQKPNGSWVFDGTNASDVAASTGLALLPFLAAGQTHRPNGTRIDYQPYVERGLNYLLSNQDPSTGRFRAVSNMYGHAIATVALCEAYGMTGDKSKLLVGTQKAVNFIQRQQGSDGSWGYNGGTGDTSIVGWQIQALKSAQMCRDIIVDKAVLERARTFLQKIAGGSKQDKYGYSLSDPGRPAPGTALTAIGLLCRYYLDGWGSDNEHMANGVSGLIERNPPKADRMNMYYYYYATQVVHFHGGKEWSEQWNPNMRDLLIGMQTKNGINVGSWDPGPDRLWMGPHTGRLGVTCMSLLTLEVYYRHLPLYKRDTTGMKELERAR
jgi:hypothetical protein